jgi:hypothetical protein
MSSGLKLTVIIGVCFRIAFCLSVKRQFEIPKCCPTGEQFNDSMACVTSNSIPEDWEWLINSSIPLNHEVTVSTSSPTILANTSLSCPSFSRWVFFTDGILNLKICHCVRENEASDCIRAQKLKETLLQLFISTDRSSA